MDFHNITLISFGIFDEEFLKKIAGNVKREFPLSVNIEEGRIDLSEFYDPARRQYDGVQILKKVDSQYSTDSAKTLGLFNVDLFIPILTYIFGQAILKGRTGIASLYRFNNERYGMDSNDEFILERFQKEVIHELGHTFGLLHCHIPTCVMRSSTYVEDIDQKSASLCPRCHNEMRSILA
jgi:archaemetzincin